MKPQSIPCPDCSTPIPFDAHQLLTGTKFSCPKCGVSIGLANDARPIVRDTLEKFEEVKKQIGKVKK